MSPRADRPLPPRLPAQLQRVRIQAIAHDAACSEAELVSLSVAEQQAKGVKLDTARVSDVDISDARLERLRVIDAALGVATLPTFTPNAPP